MHACAFPFISQAQLELNLGIRTLSLENVTDNYIRVLLTFYHKIFSCRKNTINKGITNIIKRIKFFQFVHCSVNVRDYNVRLFD